MVITPHTQEIVQNGKLKRKSSKENFKTTYLFKYKHLNIIQHIIKVAFMDMDGGVCILVKNNFIHSQVQFQADLQAVAVFITINNKTYTVASVYVPPSETLNELVFDRMIKSFSSRYLVLGDFNGHSHL